MQIKPELEDEYAQYVRLNSEDEYSQACITAGEAVGALLDAGATAEAALEGLKGHGLTGFMASAAAKGVAHFHPRGEEIRIEWNRQNGIETEKGIVNTAIIEIDDDGKMHPQIESL